MTEQPKSYINKNGDNIWYLPSKGKSCWHRLDGPAVEYNDGIKQWWVNGEQLPAEDVEIWLEENDVDLKTEEGQMAFKVRGLWKNKQKIKLLDEATKFGICLQKEKSIIIA